MKKLVFLLLSLFASCNAQTRAEVTTQVKGVLPVANGGLNNSAAPSADGQIPIWNAGASQYQPGDPIVSYNYVNLWTTQDITVTRTSTAVRVSTFSSSGTLYITYAGITGSPATCTLQIKSVDSVGNAINNGSTIALTVANGTTAQVFTSAAASITSGKMQGVFACGTYPTAGTLTLDFVPALTAILGASSSKIGVITTDQTTHGTTDLVAGDITKIGGSAVSTAAAGVQKVGLAGNAGGSMETTAGVLDTNLKNIGNSAVATAATGIQKVGISSFTGTTLETTAGVLDGNIKNIGNSAVSTAATGVIKVGIVGNAGATFDSTIGAATAPTNAVATSGVFNTTQPAPTNGQATAIQIDSASAVEVNVEGKKATYRAALTNTLWAAGVSGSFFGSATKTIRVTRVIISASSTAILNSIVVNKRSTADSAGTCTTLTQVPLDSGFAAGTATLVKSCTAVETTGTLVGAIANRRFISGNATAPIGNYPIEFDFGDKLGSTLVLRGTGQGIDFTLLAAATVDLEIEWTEE